MITKGYIDSTLKELDAAYSSAATPADAQRYAKLAIIELCGWIEESMDSIVLRCSKRHVKHPANQTYCEQKIIKRTYGFDYQDHFRFMLIRLVGLINVERLEQQVDQPKYIQMTAALSSLKALRDVEAHTHLKGTTRTLSAPSVIISKFQPVYDGLMEFDRNLRMTKF
jgi:hypothetical protein